MINEIITTVKLAMTAALPAVVVDGVEAGGASVVVGSTSRLNAIAAYRPSSKRRGLTMKSLVR